MSQNLTLARPYRYHTATALLALALVVAMVAMVAMVATMAVKGRVPAAPSSTQGMSIAPGASSRSHTPQVGLFDPPAPQTQSTAPAGLPDSVQAAIDARFTQQPGVITPTSGGATIDNPAGRVDQTHQ